MTSDSLPLRVTRLENDTEAIYEILTGIHEKQSAHDLRFDQIDAKFDQVDAKFDQVGGRLDEVDAKVDEVLRRLPRST